MRLRLDKDSCERWNWRRERWKAGQIKPIICYWKRNLNMPPRSPHLPTLIQLKRMSKSSRRIRVVTWEYIERQKDNAHLCEWKRGLNIAHPHRLPIAIHLKRMSKSSREIKLVTWEYMEKQYDNAYHLQEKESQTYFLLLLIFPFLSI